MDPDGEIVVRSRRHVENFILADIHPQPAPHPARGISRSAWSWREFAPFVEDALKPTS
jgi:hypothetical protein